MGRRARRCWTICRKKRFFHEAPGVCPSCGGLKFGKIGADERAVLQYVPAHFKRVLHVRPKMSCRACETNVQAPMPMLPIERGPASPVLLAHVLISKPICRCIASPTSMCGTGRDRPFRHGGLCRPFGGSW